jgi:hypothetical protein
VTDHLNSFTAFARPGAFVCVGALSALGRILDAGGFADGFDIRGRAVGRVCATIGLLIGLWLLYLAQGALPDAADLTMLAPTAEKPAAAVPGGPGRGIG